MISWASSKLVILGVRQRLALHKLLSRTKGSLTRYRSRRFSRLVESAFARLQFTKPRLSNVATCSAAWPASHATVACNLSRLAREIYWGQRVQSSPVFLPSLPGTRIEHIACTHRVHSALDYLSAKTHALEKTVARQLERVLILLVQRYVEILEGILRKDHQHILSSRNSVY